MYIPSDMAMEPRYRADVAVNGSASPAQILEQLALSCDGDFVKYNDTGKWALEPSTAGDASLVVDEQKLAAYPALVSSSEVNERATEYVGAYVDRNKDWQRTETMPLRSPTLKEREGRSLPREQLSFDCVTRFSVRSGASCTGLRNGRKCRR